MLYVYRQKKNEKNTHPVYYWTYNTTATHQKENEKNKEFSTFLSFTQYSGATATRCEVI